MDLDKKASNTAMFQLKKRLTRLKISHAEDSFVPPSVDDKDSPALLDDPLPAVMPQPRTFEESDSAEVHEVAADGTITSAANLPHIRPTPAALAAIAALAATAAAAVAHGGDGDVLMDASGDPSSFLTAPDSTAEAEGYNLSEDESSDDGEDEAEIEIEDEASSTKQVKKLKAQFGRRYTHNEQLFVRPCGVIIGRATMFGSEGQAEVVVCAICPFKLHLPMY